MGNTNAVFVNLNQSCGRAGELISGEVYLSIVKPQKLGIVELTIKGKEIANWVSNDYSCSAKAEIVKVKTVLHKFDENNSATGHYKFPFSFLLPLNVPGSLDVAWYSDKGSIKYSVKATCTVVGMFKSNLKHNTGLTVLQPPPFKGRLRAKDVVPVQVCLCINKGPVEFEACTDKHIYESEETIYITGNLNNTSTKPIRKVCVDLMEATDFGEVFSPRYTSIGKKVAEARFPGLRPKSQLTNIKLAVKIPKNLKTAAIGSVLSHYYFVSIRASIRMASSPICNIPIWIHGKVLQNVQTPQLPPNWNPQSFPEFRVQLPEPPMPRTLPKLRFGELQLVTPDETSNQGREIVSEFSKNDSELHPGAIISEDEMTASQLKSSHRNDNSPVLQFSSSSPKTGHNTSMSSNQNIIQRG